MINYYRILGLRDFASLQEIKTAYRKLSLKFHPDKNDADPFFTEKFKELQEAYESLSDSYRKSRYDMELREFHAAGSRPDPSNFYNQSAPHEPEEEPKQKEPQETSEQKTEQKKATSRSGKPLRTMVYSILLIIVLAYSISRVFNNDHKDESIITQPVNAVLAPPIDTTTFYSSIDTSTQLASDQPAVVQDDKLGQTGNNYFTISSSPQEVIKVQGNPTTVQDRSVWIEWHYPEGMVKFVNGRVTEFDNSSGRLKVKMIEKSEVSAGYFTTGSSPQEVLKVQGNPTTVQDRSVWIEWHYPEGMVKFVNGRVTEFDNSSGRLKVKMIEKSEVTGEYFTTGSSPQEILKAHGNPSKVLDRSVWIEWYYPEGMVKFVDGRVTEFDNSSGRLKVKF